MRRAGPNRPTTHTPHGSMNFYIEVIYTKESSDPENRCNTHKLHIGPVQTALKYCKYKKTKAKVVRKVH